MKKYIYLVLLSLVMLSLGGCAAYYETKQVQGKIVEMEFDKGHWENKTKKVDGKKKTTRKWVDDEWEITIEFNEEQKEFEFENDTIYKKFKKGDSINLELEIGYSDKDEVVSKNFYLPENLSTGLK